MKVCLVLTVNEIVLFHLNIHLSFYFNLHVKMWMNDASISGGWHFQQFLAFFFSILLIFKTYVCIDFIKTINASKRTTSIG